MLSIKRLYQVEPSLAKQASPDYNIKSMRKKIAIIGAGNVGATAAQLIAQASLADVVILDVASDIAKGKALDILEACPLWNSSVSVNGTGDYEETRNSDIVVITAGFARKPGMSRDDLLKVNADVVRGIATKISETSPDAIVIVVTNPMDVMAYLTYKVTGFHHKRVIGMGGVLDAARLKAFAAMQLKVSPLDITAIVFGGHGDAMVPVARYISVAGIPITELLPEDRINGLIERTRFGGAEIVGLLKTGSAFYAPAASITEMVKAILNDEKRIMPCSAYLTGEYGMDDVYTGVPVRLSRDGIDEIIELKLTPEERSAFLLSADAVKGAIKKLQI